MKHTNKMKLEAYRAYREAGSLEKTRALLPFDLSISTLRRWKEQYEWDKKLETDEYKLADAEPSSKQLTTLVNELNLKESDRDVYKQVKRIESICFAAIKGNQERLNDLALTPNDFNSAIRALKVCWDIRDKILSRVVRPKEDKEDKPQKVSYVQLVMNQSKEEHGSIAKERERLALGSTEDSQ